MSSTYSPSLRIQLIDTGTELEAWGTPTDNNLGTIIEQAIVGSNTISLTNLTSYTLTTANAAVDEARNAVLVFNGALTANCNVIAPSVQKVYVVSNQTTGGKFVNIKTATGNAVNVINGTNQLIYCNGTDFISAVNVNTVIGNLAVSGNSTVGGNVTVSSNIAMGNVITGTTGNMVLRSTTSNVVNFQGTTGALIPPSGTTAQRPGTPIVGMSRWNTELGWYEIWNGLLWQQITGSFVVNYLIVAGGGGGSAGGGGAGGLLSNTVSVSPGNSYPIIVGSGGAGNGSSSVNANNGANSSAFGFTAIGGGGGGNGGVQNNGSTGGSGGGAGQTVYEVFGSGGAGTAGQGYAGGANFGVVVGGAGSGGGGGAGAVGQNGGSDRGGNGGSGFTSSITGSSVTYAGGGGGGSDNIGGSGGAGGGGRGAGNATGPSTSGTNGLGGGGGAGYGSGGSGIVIVSYPSVTQKATGGTVTSYSSGGVTYWVHTFTSSGTLTT